MMVYNTWNYLVLGLCPSSILKNSKGSSHPNTEEKPLGSVYIPYVKGVSEKFKRIGNQYNIRMIFKTKHKLMCLMYD
jgi:hypothetical protein